MEKIPGLRSKPYTVWIHILVWVAFLLVPLLFIESATGRERFMIMGWFLQLLMAAYFYYNYLYLIPRFPMQKKLLVYFLMLLMGLVIISGLNLAFITGTADMVEHHHPFRFWHTVLFPVYPAIMAFALSSTLRITIEWFDNERQKKEMESEKLSSELAFLKSQVNPHFLFNILNNICSLARKKSDDTENAIIKLSQIMRYMLQDSKDEKVSLEKEVEYLQNYIELQRMRLPVAVKTDFTVEGRPGTIFIEPLLLIPFVENAFKHGISYQDYSGIIIRLTVMDRAINFSVKNKIARRPGDVAGQGSGIGLQNVMRRLELLYPGRHRLQITDDGTDYSADLKIDFS